MWNSVCAVAFMRRGLALARVYAAAARGVRRAARRAAAARRHARRARGGDLGRVPARVPLVELIGRQESRRDRSASRRALLRLLTPIAKLSTGKQAVAVRQRGASRASAAPATSRTPACRSCCATRRCCRSGKARRTCCRSMLLLRQRLCTRARGPARPRLGLRAQRARTAARRGGAAGRRRARAGGAVARVGPGHADRCRPARGASR